MCLGAETLKLYRTLSLHASINASAGLLPIPRQPRGYVPEKQRGWQNQDLI